MKTGSSKNKKDSLAEEALSKIQEAVISGDLRPNQRLIEVQLSRKFGMSRTPVREAIRRLQQMGHVTILANGGAIVTEFSQKHISDQFEIREVLETMMVKLDCERATAEQLREARNQLDRAAEALSGQNLEEFNRCKARFHDILLEACDNERLITMVKTIRNQYYLGRLARSMTETELRRNLKQHCAIMDALDDRNQAKAQKALRDLIRSIAKITLARL
jgi:DNA-binding GntR family transcriptional regulator